jgi:uncharacterized membrane protein YbhN (UPF0104 family)
VRFVRPLALAVIGVALIIAWRRLDTRALGEALRSAHLVPFAIAVVLNLVGRTLARARRTQLLLNERVPFGALVRLSLAGYAAASLVPGPAEELVTCTELARRRGFSLKELAAYQITDKSLGAISIGLVALALAPWWVAACVVLAVVVLVAHGTPRLLAPLGWLVVSNALCVAMVALCLAAVGADVSAIACVTVFLATSAASALVPMPGGIGTIESAFALVMVHAGMSAPVALAAAVLYHVAHVVPPAIVGLPALLRMSWEGRPCSRA